LRSSSARAPSSCSRRRPDLVGDCAWRRERPLGRGVNFQIRVADVAALYARVVDAGLDPFIPMEERWYRRDDVELGNKQFAVADPDGYLLRFFSDLGRRPVSL
jgi:hypothetical protein